MYSRIALFFLLACSFHAATAQGGYGWGLRPGSSGYNDRITAFYLAYYPSPRPVIVPQTRLNINPEAIPVVLGWSRTMGERHLLGVDAGLTRREQLEVLAGSTDSLLSGITPQVRLSYRIMPLGGDHAVEPYLGAGIVLSPTISDSETRPFHSFQSNSQLILGLRVFTGSPVFLHLEVPYTFANWITYPNTGSTGYGFNLLSTELLGQFWPLFGVGVTW